MVVSGFPPMKKTIENKVNKWGQPLKIDKMRLVTYNQPHGKTVENRI